MSMIISTLIKKIFQSGMALCYCFESTIGEIWEAISMVKDAGIEVLRGPLVIIRLPLKVNGEF